TVDLLWGPSQDLPMSGPHTTEVPRGSLRMMFKAASTPSRPDPTTSPLTNTLIGPGLPSYQGDHQIVTSCGSGSSAGVCGTNTPSAINTLRNQNARLMMESFDETRGRSWSSDRAVQR